MNPRILASCIALAGLSGCASLINPHVKPAVMITTEPVESLADVQVKAEAWRQAYHKALGEHSVMRNLMGAAIVPLAAGGTHQALQETTNRNQIARYAVASTTLFALAQQYTSKPRQAVYLGGMGALTCVMLSASALPSDAKQLSTLLDKHAGATGNLASEIAKVASSDSADLLAAKNTFNAGEILLKKAYALEELTLDAPNVLSQRINQVNEAVSEAVRKGEPDVSSLINLLAQFRPMTLGVIEQISPGGLAGGLAAQSAGARSLGDDGNNGAGDDSLGALRNAHGELAKSNAELGAYLATFAQAQTEVAAASQCAGGVKFEAAWGISPDVTQIALQVGQVYLLSVQARSGFPGVRLDSPGTAVEMVTLINPGLVNVTLTAKAPSKTPSILAVTGPDGNTRSISISVTAAPGAAPDAQQDGGDRSYSSDGDQSSAERASIEKVILVGSFKTKVQELQRGLGLSEADVVAGAGHIGPKTRAAVRACRAKLGLPQGAHINVEFINVVLAKACA